MKFKRIFAIVMDSVGIGSEPDADRFYNDGHDDVGSNTWLHISEKMNGLHVPVINSLGIHDLCPVVGTSLVDHPHSYVLTMRERSNGKDTLTGHWEMMGILTEDPLVTFTETGFPKELIDELTKKSGVEFLGNYSSSGTVILDELGEQSIREKKMILYTSADSVLQIAASLEVFTIEKLYETCAIARKITMRKEWKVGRVIARPFLGTKAGSFVRTTQRQDYSVSPSGNTAMMDLIQAGYTVHAVGKIHDIFAGTGMTDSVHIDSNHDGMLKTMEIAKKDFTGLCFVNLADFDVLYGHRRNPVGYGKCIEEFDQDLGNLISHLNQDDLLLITADHGNDPTWYGTDHTRERVPLFCYSPSFQHGCKLDERDSFADMGKTILLNFGVSPSNNEIGTPIQELMEN
jgi:phosphopentomutase